MSDERRSGPVPDPLWERLAGELVDPSRPLSEAAVRALEAACPAAAIDPLLSSRLDDLLDRAVRDAEFEASLRQPGGRRTLGAYLGFLRREWGMSVREASRRFDIDFQLLSDLERDRVPPQRIPARPLAALVRHLRGSLQMLEQLLVTTVRAPRFTGDSASRYRAARGASRSEAEAASQAARGGAGARENPEFRRELEAAAQLRLALREAWLSRHP